MHVQTDGALTTANYTCAQNYTLYGQKIRTCQSDNTWDYEMPACSKFILTFNVVTTDLITHSKLIKAM